MDGVPDSLRTIPATLPSTLPMATVLLLVVFLAHPETYSWTGEQQSGLRGVWLSRPFFIARSSLYLGLWMLSARLLTRPAASSRVAAAVLAVLALTGWLAASDWLMSLTPQWTSTIFGVYVFVGFVVSAVAAMLLTCIWVRVRNPTCRSVSEGQLRDLATMLLGFSCLWAYLWFCQYMLIWYTNQPHEIGYYVVRTGDGWHLLFYATVVLKWALPFVLLLGKAGKRRLAVLALAAFSAIVGHWIDLYVMIFPDVAKVRVCSGLLETGIALGLGAVCAWVLRNYDPLEDFVFFFNFVFRLYWGFVGNRFAEWRNFILHSKQQIAEIKDVLRIDILFRKAKPLGSIGHNSLAGFTYFISFLVFLFQAITGFGMYAAMSHAFIPRMFAWIVPLMGGDFAVRQWHHVMMWFFIIFSMIHIYLVFYHDYVEGRGVTSSMVGGWKFIEKERR